MRLVILCLLCLSTCPFAVANDATVTFYPAGSYGTTGLPGSKHGVFSHGAIFDGQQRLVVLTRRRFVTMKFSPGEHNFSASYSGKHPAANSHLFLNLEPGKSYFIRAESESSGVIVVEFFKGRLDQVSCAEAHAELTKAAPVEEKEVSKAVIDRLIPLPACH